MTNISVTGSALNGSLMKMLVADDIYPIEPGTSPSYELCKTIYTYHPLGQKMAESPIRMAQSQRRNVAIQGGEAPPEILQAFLKEWAQLGVDSHILNVSALSRVYGLASVVVGVEGVAPGQPLDMDVLWDQPIYFNVYDPLNTAGSLVLNQVPTAPDFNKPVVVRVSGQEFHRSRYQVVMNERPVYLQYTGSAFGFVGRSVYQRALYPLKSFIRTMIADDLIATKLALLVVKAKAPGSVLDNVMGSIMGIKRNFLKEAQTGNVLSIDIDEEIETLNMQNADGAGAYARNNILKNVATAADMPAQLLDNETMVEGFGEGTEDAKNIARYIESVRAWMHPVYGWFDNIVQHRAWNPMFYEYIQTKYPSRYEGIEYKDAFSQWRSQFEALWPSYLIEPESERIKVDEVRLEGVISILGLLLPELDPVNKTKALQWAVDCVGANKQLFEYALEIDFEALNDFQEEQQVRKEDNESKMIEKAGMLAPPGGGPGGGKGPPGAAKAAPGAGTAGSPGAGAMGGGAGAAAKPKAPTVSKIR